MSRIGKQPIAIPEKTEVEIKDGLVNVKGPLGELNRKVLNDVSIDVKEGNVVLLPKKPTRFAKALWGTYASHISNMIQGVNTHFEKKLVVEGVGYKVETTGKEIILNVGFSHPVKLTIPENIEVIVEKNTITIKGINKEVVGEFSANIRAIKKPEPYKGKGIRYEDEVVRRKQGKKVV